MELWSRGVRVGDAEEMEEPGKGSRPGASPVYLNHVRKDGFQTTCLLSETRHTYSTSTLHFDRVFADSQVKFRHPVSLCSKRVRFVRDGVDEELQLRNKQDRV